jgi:hypothetical protein
MKCELLKVSHSKLQHWLPYARHYYGSIWMKIGTAPEILVEDFRTEF